MRALGIGIFIVVIASVLTWVALADAPDLTRTDLTGTPRSPFSRALVAPSDEARALFPGGAHPITTEAMGRVPTGLTTLDADGCGTCHAEIAAEWRVSPHAASWTEPVFQAAYVHEPLAFCRDCHAPMNHQARTAPRGVAASDGVSCAACHVRDGVVLGPGRATSAPHPMRVTTTITSSDYCAPCHEFGFLSSGGPGAHAVETAELQQATFSEWRAWPRTGEAASCQSCHMPESKGHRRHDFAASRDPAMLARGRRHERSPPRRHHRHNRLSHNTRRGRPRGPDRRPQSPARTASLGSARLRPWHRDNRLCAQLCRAKRARARSSAPRARRPARRGRHVGRRVVTAARGAPRSSARRDPLGS